MIEGNKGDLYINKSNGDLYEKTNNNWELIFNLKAGIDIEDLKNTIIDNTISKIDDELLLKKYIYGSGLDANYGVINVNNRDEITRSGYYYIAPHSSNPDSVSRWNGYALTNRLGFVRLFIENGTKSFKAFKNGSTGVWSAWVDTSGFEEMVESAGGTAPVTWNMRTYGGKFRSIIYTHTGLTVPAGGAIDYNFWPASNFSRIIGQSVDIAAGGGSLWTQIHGDGYVVILSRHGTALSSGTITYKIWGIV